MLRHLQYLQSGVPSLKFDRREFLRVVGATGAAAALGSFLSVPRDLLISIQRDTLQAKADYRFDVEDNWVPSVCLQCPAGCGVVARVVDGNRVVKIEGNPLHPINMGGICPKAHYGLQILYDPDRIRGPMRRVGDRRSDKFEEISWGVAVKELGQRLAEMRKAGEPHRLLWLDGRVRGNIGDLFSRFMRSFGSPNRIGHSSICSDGAVIAHYLTQGVKHYMGYDWANANYLLLFGGSFLEAWRPTTRLLRSYGHIRRERPLRAKLVVVEVRKSTTASKADEWIQIRPGTDGALALAIAHVIIRERLYSVDFVEEHTSGFEDYRDIVLAEYPPDWASRITGVPVADIHRIAREFATTKPAISAGQRGAMMQPNGVFNYMAIHALNALVGSLGVPGGVIAQEDIPFTAWPDLRLDDVAEDGVRQPRIDLAGSEEYPFAKNVYQQVAESILKAQPYLPELMITYYTNPVFSSPNIDVWNRALEKVPFLVSTSPFWDEFASTHADLILPDHTYLERWQDDVIYPSLGYPVASIRQPVIQPVYGTMNVGDLLLSLAREIGGTVAEAFPWSDFRDVLRYRWTGIWESGRGKVGPLPVSHLGDFETFWQTVLKYGFWCDPPYKFLRYEHEFRTPTKRFEFRSHIMEEKFTHLSKEIAAREKIGEDEAMETLLTRLRIKARGRKVFLPHFEEPNFSGDASEYPFILISYKSIMHAEGRGTNSPWALSSFGPQVRKGWRNWIEIHPEAAQRIGVADGDTVYVETPKGRMKTKARVYETASPEIVAVPFGIGRKAYGRWASRTGDNVNEVLIEERERLSGSAGFFSTRARIIVAV